MTKEEIIRIARDAGAIPIHKRTKEFAVVGNENIERFFKVAYAAGAAAEREACAKVADSISEDQWALYKGRPPYTGQELERASDYTQGKSDGAEVCAAAIRARGEK